VDYYGMVLDFINFACELADFNVREFRNKARGMGARLDNGGDSVRIYGFALPHYDFITQNKKRAIKSKIIRISPRFAVYT
jgi:hypothetical protein